MRARPLSAEAGFAGVLALIGEVRVLLIEQRLNIPVRGCRRRFAMPIYGQDSTRLNRGEVQGLTFRYHNLKRVGLSGRFSQNATLFLPQSHLH